MICPHCNTPNPPEAVYCIGCNALLPSPVEEKRQRRIAVARAVLLAVLLPAFYFFMLNYVVGGIWMLKFSVTVPRGITQSEFATLFNETFNRDSAYLNLISACLCLLTVAAYFATKKRSLAEAANIYPASPAKLGAAFVCGLTLQIPIGIVLSLIPFPETIVENHNEIMNACTSPMWVQLLYGVILAPIAEEIFFRGITHDRLSKVMPVPLAAVLSSFGFAVIHAEPIQIAVAFVCGYMFALLYSKFRTVTVPIAFHMGFNLLSYIVALIKDPLLLIAAGTASVALFIGSTYILLRREDTDV